MWWGYCRHSGRRLRGQSQWASRGVRPIPSVLQTGDCSLLRAQSHLFCLHRVLTPGVPGESISNKMNSSNLACVFGLQIPMAVPRGPPLGALVPPEPCYSPELLIEYR